MTRSLLFRRVAVACVLSAVVLSCGCVAPSPVETQTTSPSTPSVSSSPEPTLGLSLRDPNGLLMYAIVGGTLVFRGGCLLLDNSDSLTVPVFERGSVSFDGETLVYLGSRYQLGDDVQWGGGWMDDPVDLDSLGLPSTCPATGIAQVNGPPG